MRERADHDGAASGPLPARRVPRGSSPLVRIPSEGTARSRGCAATLAAAVGAALAFTPAAARADPEPRASPTGAAELVAPRPFGALEAEYPAGAQGDADVILELTIDPSGLVAAARVVRGDEPFGAAALAASPAWRFTPPLRGDERVTARVRAVVHFTAQAPVAEPPPASAAAAPARDAPSPASGSAPARGAPPPLEVEVRGQANVPAASTMTRAEVRLLPGAFGDPFRAIESMPGVTPIASGVPYFYVRGAPPGNVGYYLDGIRVPILFHLGLGPSVVHPALVDRVDLYEGGYPAQYGRFAGAIVSGETKPPTPELHGEGNIRLVDAGAMVEAPFDGGRGTVLVGGRYGYTALLLELVAPDVQLGYGDYQARASYQLTAKDQVSAFVFGSYDHWATKEGGTFHTLFDTQFHRLDLRYDHALDGGGTLRNAVTLGIDRTALDEGRVVLDRMVATRLEIVKPLSPDVLGRFGADVVLDAISSDLDRQDDSGTQASLNSLFPSRDDLTVGVRGDVVIQMGPRLELTPGLRVDLYGSNGASAIGFDPRLAARFAITRDVRLIQADGMASQPPSFFLPGPGLSPALTGGLQRALQTSAAIEVDLPAEVTASVGGFHDAFFDMTDPLSVAPTSSHIPDNFAVRADGQSYGLEVSVKRKLTKRLGGFFSYTLSRSTRNVDRLVVPSAFDRTHVLDTAATYDFGRGYHAGARVVFYTGAPSAITSANADAIEHPPRLPPFFRLDVRLEKRWTLGKRAWISLVIEVLNATATKETVGVDCSGQPDPFGASGACSNQVIGPVIIPSIGVEAGF